MNFWAYINHIKILKHTFCGRELGCRCYGWWHRMPYPQGLCLLSFFPPWNQKSRPLCPKQSSCTLSWSYKCLPDGFRDSIFQQSKSLVEAMAWVSEAGGVHFYHFRPLSAEFIYNFISSYFKRDLLCLKTIFILLKEVAYPMWPGRVFWKPPTPAYRRQVETKPQNSLSQAECYYYKTSL